MKSFFTRIGKYYSLIYKIIVLVLTIGLLAYLLPREVRFKYEFSKGKVWQYDHLYASFPFSVLKTDEELKEEEDLIRENARKYYYRENKVIAEQLSLFNSNFDNAIIEKENSKAKGLKALFINDSVDIDVLKPLKSIGQTVLRNLFEKGIVRLASGEKEFIYLKSEKTVKMFPSSHFYTIQTASDYVRSIQIDEQQRRFLIPLIQNVLADNIFFDEEATKKDLESTLAKITDVKGSIEENSLIVAKGKLITPDTYQILISYKEQFVKRNTNNTNLVLMILGQILLVSICILILFFFINQFREDIIEDTNNLRFILFNVVLMFGMAKLCISINPEAIYAMPFCILPLVLKAFYDTRLAMFCHLITTILIAFIVPNSFEFIYIELMGGIVSILAVISMYKRADLFLSATKIITVYGISYFALAVIQNNSLMEINYWNLMYLAIGGGLTVMAYPLIYLFEKVFGLISDVSLLELSDTNNPLLKKLQEVAPGTFQHSLQVANLAETAANEIGANALLVRTGSLYHDIGKMDSPLYFIENQATGVNPHDDLPFEESAGVIIGHVIQGIEIAKKHNLPDRIIDFIRTHHGTSTVQYFYRQYLKSFPEGELDKDAFSYPGPKPFSRETAILMMADSVEAASKSLTSPSLDSIHILVDKIIDHQMGEGQFDNADITFKEINMIKKIFKQRLRNIYHLRIEYPD